MKQVLSALIAALFAAVTMSAAAQAPAPSTDKPVVEKKAKKTKKAKKSKKTAKADAGAPAAAGTAAK